MLLMLVPIYGVSQGSCLFISYEPSCINLAIGGRAVGNVNIWHKSALTTYANPAVGAYREGVSWGFSEKDWLKDTGFGLKYNASLVNIGYKGMSITLPSYRLSELSGQYLDAGIAPLYDDHWNVVGEFHSYDTAGVYGFACDAVKLGDDYISSSFVKEHLMLACGITYKDITSYLYPAGSAVGVGEGSCWDVGTAARFSWEDISGVGVEAVGAYTHNNVFNGKAGFGDGLEDPLWECKNFGYAVGVNLSGEKVLGDIIDPKLIYFDNLVSFRYLSSTANESGDKSKGYGAEWGLMDTFFIRKGRYEDYEGEIVGNTFGYGIDLHYKDIVSLSWNYAEYPGGVLMNGPQKAEDINVNLDFLSIGKEINKLFVKR
jgi:hypothetical protein